MESDDNKQVTRGEDIKTGWSASIMSQHLQ